MLKNSLIERTNQTAKQSNNEAIFFSKTTRRCIKIYFSISRHIINLLKPNTYFMYRQLYHSEIVCSAHIAFMCFAWISEQTAIISVYSIRLSGFITEAESVCCAVRTGPSNKTDTFLSFKG